MIIKIIVLVIVVLIAYGLLRKFVLVPRRARRKAAAEARREAKEQERCRHEREATAKHDALADELKALVAAAYGGDRAARDRLKSSKLVQDFAGLLVESSYNHTTRCNYRPYKQLVDTWKMFESESSNLVRMRDELIAIGNPVKLHQLTAAILKTLDNSPEKAPQNYRERFGLDRILEQMRARARELIVSDAPQLSTSQRVFNRYLTIINWTNGADLRADGQYYNVHDRALALELVGVMGENIQLYHQALVEFVPTPRYYDFRWEVEQYRAGEMRLWAAEALRDKDLVVALRILAYIDFKPNERDEVRELAAELAKMVARIRAGLPEPALSPAEPSTEE